MKELFRDNPFILLYHSVSIFQLIFVVIRIRIVNDGGYTTFVCD